MKIEDLKEQILNKTLKGNFFVFVYNDYKFLPKQYAKEIAKIQGKTIVNIESIEECQVDDFFGGFDLTTMYVLDIDKLEVATISNHIMQSILDNNIPLIIICTKIDNQNAPIGTGVDTLFSLDVIVEFPKLLSWQVLEYMKTKCSLDEPILKWLQEISKDNIYRIENELEKLVIFDSSEQLSIFNQINSENGYGDLNSFDIFNLTNAIMKKDYKTISDILKSIEFIDVEPVGLITILYNNIKNVINIQLDPMASADKLGMNPKQFNAIKYNCGRYTSGQLLNMFNFITSLDSRLKGGKLQLTDKQFIDYIVCCII